MEYSKKYKYLFFANPKTGSRAVSKALDKWDIECYHNKRSGNLNGDEVVSGVGNHIMPYKLKAKMGDLYNHFRVIVFVGSPYGRAVSTYFFYKGGGTRTFNKKHKSVLKSRLLYFISKLNLYLTLVFPFPIYSLVKPLKTN